jgi:predicted RNase H-like HicB family nuclease
MTKKLTAIIGREGYGYVPSCPKLDIANYGNTIEQARENLKETLELFFETTSSEDNKAKAP